MARHLAPFSWRQRMAEIVRRRSFGAVLPLGRHASTSGSSLIQCASVSIAPPHARRAKRPSSQPVQARTGPSVILHVLNSAAAFAVAVLLFAMIFKILPDVDLTWRDVGTGAVITGVLFTVGKFLIGLYLGMSTVASSFGAAASIITILLWVYYSSLILLYGAEFTKVYAESHGSRAG